MYTVFIYLLISVMMLSAVQNMHKVVNIFTAADLNKYKCPVLSQSGYAAVSFAIQNSTEMLNSNRNKISHIG